MVGEGKKSEILGGLAEGGSAGGWVRREGGFERGFEGGLEGGGASELGGFKVEGGGGEGEGGCEVCVFMIFGGCLPAPPQDCPLRRTAPPPDRPKFRSFFFPPFFFRFLLFLLCVQL